MALGLDTQLELKFLCLLVALSLSRSCDNSTSDCLAQWHPPTLFASHQRQHQPRHRREEHLSLWNYLQRFSKSLRIVMSRLSRKHTVSPSVFWLRYKALETLARSAFVAELPMMQSFVQKTARTHSVRFKCPTRTSFSPAHLLIQQAMKVNGRTPWF